MYRVIVICAHINIEVSFSGSVLLDGYLDSYVSTIENTSLHYMLYWCCLCTVRYLDSCVTTTVTIHLYYMLYWCCLYVLWDTWIRVTTTVTIHLCIICSVNVVLMYIQIFRGYVLWCYMKTVALLNYVHYIFYFYLSKLCWSISFVRLWICA